MPRGKKYVRLCTELAAHIMKHYFYLKKYLVDKLWLKTFLMRLIVILGIT